MAADHGGAQAYFAQQHLRRGYRPAGGGSNQAFATAQSFGRRKRRDHQISFQIIQRARPARFGQQHQMRQFAHRPGFL